MIQIENQELSENQSEIKISSKPPYLLGFLGFIPLVGFFVGIALVLYGLIKYKSKKLILIGFLCMTFTILAYSALFYIGFVSDFGKKGWNEHSQMELTTLVKHVEFYKIENGKYPDSIQQLETKNEFIFLADPTQMQKQKAGKTIYFNYKNLGNRYLLFSSGNDGIPNTKDDIYPKVKINKNIGWVKNQ